ncbi:MAG: hypothetical protein AAFO07_25875 [Bacteroidota bacterium]
METRNSFKELMREDAQEFGAKYSEDVKTNVKGTLGVFRFIGEIVEIYLSRIVDIVILAFKK